MKNKAPGEIKYIICEGQTELLFLEKLKSLFGSKYNLEFINAKGKEKFKEEYKRIKKINSYADIYLMRDLDGVNDLGSIRGEFTKAGNQ